MNNFYEETSSEDFEFENFLEEEYGANSNTDTINLTFESADYYLNRLKLNKKKIEEIDFKAKMYKAEYEAKIEAWQKRRSNLYQRDIDHCSEILEAYFNKVEIDPAKKVSLPSGTIGFYKTREKINYDEALLTKYLLEHENFQKYISVKPSINKNLLKKEATYVDGQMQIGNVVLPGVSITEAVTKFGVK